MKFTLFEKTPVQHHKNYLMPTLPSTIPLPPQARSQENIFMRNHTFEKMRSNMIGFVNSGKACGTCPKK